MSNDKNNAMWTEARRAFNAGFAAEEDAEVLNAWSECEGNNPWGRNHLGDPGTMLRLAYQVVAAQNAGNEAELAKLRTAWRMARAAMKVVADGAGHPERA
jgi:hypothetical protein